MAAAEASIEPPADAASLRLAIIARGEEVRVQRLLERRPAALLTRAPCFGNESGGRRDRRGGGGLEGTDRLGDESLAEAVGGEEAVEPLQRIVHVDDGVADDLPPLVENRQQVQLTPEQAKLYDTVVQDMLRKVDEATGIRRRGLVLSGLVRLKQICNHPAHFLRETDLAPANGSRALIP